MKPAILVILALGFLLSLNSNATGQIERDVAFDDDDAQAVFDEALRIWDQAVAAEEEDALFTAEDRYHTVAARWRQLIDQGYGNATVYFNLGLVCERLDRKSEAVWALRMAEELQPLDGDISETLAWVRGVGGERPMRSPGVSMLRVIRGWMNAFIPVSFTALLASGAVLFWIGRAMIRRNLVQLGGAASTIGVIVGVAALSGLVINRLSTRDVISVVARTDDTVFRRSIGPVAPRMMTLTPRAGDEFRVTSVVGDWFEVDFDEGTAWVARHEVFVVDLAPDRGD